MKGCLEINEITLECLEWGEMHSSSELLLQIMTALAITPSEAMMISSGFISVQVLAYLLKKARRSLK